MTQEELAAFDALKAENERFRLAWPCDLGKEPGCPNPGCWVHRVFQESMVEVEKERKKVEAIAEQLRQTKQDLKTLRAALTVIRSIPETD
jgi:hypothetical protein